MISVRSYIKVDSILSEYQDLSPRIQWTQFGNGKQTGLQYRANEGVWDSAVGRRFMHQTSYDNLNPFFKDTIFETLINEYQMYRTRLMWIGPYSCYSMHRDLAPRIHIPLITNPQCYFVFRDSGIQHLSAGNVYWVDARKFHTFMNCSDQHRLHLVGMVES